METTQLQDFRLYTIGWVAALSKELTAAKTMLDENHDQPANFRQNLSDTNNYTWGRVGKHNIVIASLPEGKYGLVSAAVTASFMISSLPHLRFGLMVGIGAGIPRPGKDIRLGDVVVSTPAGEHPGVVQYDLGKLENDGRFKRVGSLAPPPRILLTTLTNLKATLPLEGSQMPSILDAMLERYLLLRSQQHGYFHQGPQNDRLFIASSVHVGDDDASQPPFVPTAGSYLQLALGWLWSLLLFLCTARWKPPQNPLGAGLALSGQTGDAARPQVTTTETCTRCDPTKEIQRSTRSNDHPMVHYGVIASGNIVVKDGLSRDAILDRLGPECICFEMEAAGLMDNFPCLVIRGICDYANNHKSDQWQNYAAATAAAYAKELLVGYIRAEDVQNADRIEELMGRVAKDTSQIAKTTTVTQEAVQKLHDSDRYRKIMKWLSPPNTNESYQKALETRQPGTGQWFLESKMYSAWKKTSHSSLWLHGIPGCGKTILSSTVIENLSQSEPDAKILLYFYFSFADAERQSLNGAIRSLISQLLSQSKDADDYLVNLFESKYKEDSRTPTTAQLSSLFDQMASKTEEIWIVVDALDECQTREDPNNVTKGLLTWLQNLAGSNTINAHILVTSRPVYDIRSSLGNYIDYQVSLQSHLVEDDIQTYVHSMVWQNPALSRWRGKEEIQREIENHLVEEAQGMFRWVACQLDILKRCITYPALQQRLNSLPETLDETYESILNNIPAMYEEDSKKLLQFLVFSEGTLSLEDAVEIIAVQPKQPRPRFDPKNRMPIPAEITTYLSSLVVIVDQEDMIFFTKRLQLAHFSVKEYLLSDRLLKPSYSQIFQNPSAAAFMAETCLVYLLELDGNLRQVEGFYPQGTVERSYPLASYAFKYWAVHARRAGNNMNQKLIEEFIDSEDAFNIGYHYINYWDGVRGPSLPLYSYMKTRLRAPDDTPGLLYYMAYNGMLSAVCHILKKNPSGVNDTFGGFGTALHAASNQGHTEIVRTLLGHGAKINLGNYMCVTDTGRTYMSCTALECSVRNGHTDTTRLLLEQGADVNAKDTSFGNLFERAAANKDSDAIQLLLHHGIDHHVPSSGMHCDAFRLACAVDSVAIVDLLLQNGANPNAKLGLNESPLQVACSTGSESIMELLLQQGADVNAIGWMGTTVLCTAAWEGRLNVIKTLLQHGADPNMSDTFSAPLRDASRQGHYDIVQTLLERGTTKGIMNFSLPGAVECDREAVVKLLLDAGADPDMDAADICYEFGNGLLEASCRRHKNIMKMLLERGAKISPGTGTENSDYCKALYAASGHNLNAVVGMLLSVCERAEHHIEAARRMFNAKRPGREQRIDGIVGIWLNNGAMDLDSLKALGAPPEV